MSNDSYAVVKAIIPTKVKEEAVDILDQLGISQTEAILSLFNYIATNRDFPFKRECIITFNEE